MITLEEIAGRLKDKTDYTFAVNKISWEPQKLDHYVLPEFIIKESKAKGAETKLKNKLSKVLAFIDLVKHKRFKTACTVMPISVTNKDNLAIWQVYDCFYSTGSNNEEWGLGADSENLFKEMISKGVKLNFEYFLKTYWG